MCIRDSRCTGMSYMNFPRVLLCAMNNGVDLTSKKRFTKGYGYFTEMETYEDLLAAWDKTVREMTRDVYKRQTLQNAILGRIAKCLYQFKGN